MALIGSYSVTLTPGYESVTRSDLYDNIDDLLINLLDNQDNLIEPIDIRSPIYSLWKKVDDLSVVVATAASASYDMFYSNSTPVPVSLGGISSGTTFSNVSISEMFNKLLYPYQAPVPTISIVGSTTIEFGDPTKLASNSINLNWGVTKRSNDITSISVNGIIQPGSPWSGDVTGSQQRTGTYSPGLSSTQTFTIQSSDVTSTTSASATLTWMNRVYSGTISLSSIGNPNLELFPGSASLVSSLVTDSVIENLSDRPLSTTKNRTLTGIGGGGTYLVFAWPSSVSGATSPTFTVGGFTVTAFTRLRTSQPFVNQHGFSTNYEVWISNTAQNSSVNVIIS